MLNYAFGAHTVDWFGVIVLALILRSMVKHMYRDTVRVRRIPWDKDWRG